ncbi:MAG TPA: VOC family protein [Chloroflexota bacterium]|nr:VOC family protein [Chloroflexota bacterium]
MDPRMHLLTLGVTDLDRSVRFYRDGLGWPTSMKEGEDVAFFQLGPMVLALWGREQLAEDARMPAGEKAVFSGVAPAQCVASKAEVDAIQDKARAAGATITKPASDTFWGGYSCYFTDPDGYAWEIAWNPFWELTPDGGVRLPSG